MARAVEQCGAAQRNAGAQRAPNSIARTPPSMRPSKTGTAVARPARRARRRSRARRAAQELAIPKAPRSR